MKFWQLLLLVNLLVSCSEEQKTDYDWLLGQWERTNNAEGKTTFEQWTKVSNQQLEGLGFTLMGTDTTFKELMTLHQVKGNWQLDIRGVNETLTIFTITEHDSASFVAENPNHDFPKKIVYYKTASGFSASVSNDEMEIEFDFMKK